MEVVILKNAHNDTVCKYFITSKNLTRFNFCFCCRDIYIDKKMYFHVLMEAEGFAISRQHVYVHVYLPLLLLLKNVTILKLAAIFWKL